jgi:hypothetical protein
MGLYLNTNKEALNENCRLAAINESFAYLTSDGKTLKSKIEELIDSTSSKEAGSKFASQFMVNYDKEKAEKVSSFITSQFSGKAHASNIAEVGNLSAPSHLQYFLGIYKGNIYHITVDYRTYGVRLVSFKELEASKCIIPIDIIEKSLTTFGGDCNIIISKNSIKSSRIKGSNKSNNKAYNALIKYSNSKYEKSGLTAHLSKISGVQFTKSK